MSLEHSPARETGRRLIHPKQASDRLGVSLRTLEKMRQDGKGPPYIKVGHLVRYTPEGLDAYERENTFNSVSASKAARAA